jgi:rhodanese-related sulfurtransferase
MFVPTVDPQEAKRLLEKGAILIDIREADEHARERIPGARHLPLAELDEAGATLAPDAAVIFHCRSGARTRMNAPRLVASAGNSREVYLLDGGLDAWRKAGMALVTDDRRPIELQRQVQIGAGAMALAGTLLGLLISPWFFAVPAFVGAGLVFAGATGFCGMARALMRAPWNRAPSASPPTDK